MELKKLLELQSQRGAKLMTAGETNTKTFDTVLTDCRKEIQRQSDEYKNVKAEDKKEKIKAIIVNYVMNNKPLVEGFIDEENKPDTIKLADKLVEDITDYSILASAMMDEDIYEIRGNCKEIKIEKGGRIKDLRDKEGNILSFSSPEQQEIILRKLLGDVRITPKDALVNARTIEGYRIAAVHSSAISPDPNEPNGDKYHAFVLRKFHKSKLTLGDIVLKSQTMSDNMARLLALCPAGGLTFFTVGPTASGKTTTNNAILQAVPATTRTILIQNPSEIDLRFRDETGRVYNDVLHLEASEKENPTASDATASNCMDHSLRLSPTFLCFGELRTKKEFGQAMTILEAGHPMNTTYHSESSAGAIRRFLTSYNTGNEDTSLTLANLTELLNIIIVQKIMKDGSRRIIQISEVIGVDPTNKNEPLINDLYKFVTTKEPDYDASGNVKQIYGVHKRVGKLSEKTIEKFRLEGVAKARYDFMVKDVNNSEVETYTGKDINRYGMNIK